MRRGTSSWETVWDELSSRTSASWYLDPLVAEQKRSMNAALIRAVPHHQARVALKTDSFEEAFGKDSPLPEILPWAAHWVVMDRAFGIAARARSRFGGVRASFLAADLRRMPMAGGSIDMVFSNSSLDHFRSRAEFDASIGEISRVLTPGGHLILTVDNSLNPLYWPLRLICGLGYSPFPLGYSPSPRRLRTVLERAGFRLAETGVMIHNPRVVSTALFLLLRWVLGMRANRSIAALLAGFQWLDRLPTRRFTACFVTVRAVRGRESSGP